MVPCRLLSLCVNDMSTMGTLESPGGLTWVCGTSDVIGSVVPVVWPEDVAVGVGVGCSTACSDGVSSIGMVGTSWFVFDLFLRWSACFLMRLMSALQAFMIFANASSSVM